jgi:bifunctional non-homologous end joining protein LigD
VSTPLKWSEVRKGLDPARFTIKTMPKRIEMVGDMWERVLGPGIELAKMLERLQKIAPVKAAQDSSSNRAL